jgi:hypothetical protein
MVHFNNCKIEKKYSLLPFNFIHSLGRLLSFYSKSEPRFKANTKIILDGKAKI